MNIMIVDKERYNLLPMKTVALMDFVAVEDKDCNKFFVVKDRSGESPRELETISADDIVNKSVGEEIL